MKLKEIESMIDIADRIKSLSAVWTQSRVRWSGS